jgi:hypothetical protein
MRARAKLLMLVSIIILFSSSSYFFIKAILVFKTELWLAWAYIGVFAINFYTLLRFTRLFTKI